MGQFLNKMQEMNDKISDWILEHANGVHSGISVCRRYRNNGKQRGKLQ